MSGEGFANLNDLIFLIRLKIKNVLVVNRYKGSFESAIIDKMYQSGRHSRAGGNHEVLSEANLKALALRFPIKLGMTMSGEGFASLNDLIFLIWLKIKNVLVVNRYKRSFDSAIIDRHQKKVVIVGHEANRTIELMKAFKSNCKNE